MDINIEENLKLVPIDQVNGADLSSINKILSNENVTRYLPINTHHSLEDTESFLNQFLNKNSHLWFIKFQENIIGIIDLIKNSDQSMNLAYILDENYWGKGIGSKIIGSIVNYAFISLSAEVIKAPVISGNVGSEKVLFKNGFTKSSTADFNGLEVTIYEVKKDS